MPWPEQPVDCSITPEALAAIAGHERLIEHLGHWPTFHDFEVVSIKLERSSWALTSARDLQASFLVFDLGKAPDDPERRAGIADFLFEEIDSLSIKGFSHQNPIMGLSIKAQAERFNIAWGGTCMDHDVSFTCGRISVVRVIDLNPFRKSRPPFP